LRKIDEKNTQTLKIKILRDSDKESTKISKPKPRTSPIDMPSPSKNQPSVSPYSFRRVQNKYLKNHQRSMTQKSELQTLDFPKRVRAKELAPTMKTPQNPSKKDQSEGENNSSTKIKIKNPFKLNYFEEQDVRRPSSSDIKVFQPPREKCIPFKSPVTFKEFLKKEKLQAKFINSKGDCSQKAEADSDFFSLNLPLPDPILVKKPVEEEDFELAPATKGESLLIKKSKCSKVSDAMEEENFVEIVDNLNRKVKVAIPKLFDYSKFTENIPNPIDTCGRDENFRSYNFTTEYKSGYAPIETQKLIESKEKEFTYRNHFIKKKQSCANINLKRTCGVSYVKHTESKQSNVNHIFETLPPLVYQCSTGKKRLDEYRDFYEFLFHQLFDNKMPEGYFLLGTLVPSDHEDKMKEYLLYPNKRLELCDGK
jgi:hypothetical protein